MLRNNKFTCLLIVALLLGNYLKAGVNSNAEVNNNVIKLILKFPAEKYVEIMNGNLKIRDYIDFTDPSRPGEIKLPYKEVVIAIPPYSNPIIADISFVENIESLVIPELNPIARKINDSTIVYDEVDIPKQANVNNGLEKRVEIIEKFWFRDFYCAKIRINTYAFNEEKTAFRIFPK